MRYFTKEWYKDSLIAEMCFQLRKTEKASVFSDKFYEKLYEIEKKAYLRHSKRTAKLRKTAFDPIAARAEFDANYEENLAFVKDNLPNDILADIKDIRVLALGSVTHEMATRITRYCGRVHNRCEAKKRQYDEATDETVDRMGGMIPPLFDVLAGCPIATVSLTDGTAILTTSNEYSDAALKITMSCAELVENDEVICGSTIAEYELLPYEESKIEFSVLAIADDASLHTLTFVADAISIEEI